MAAREESGIEYTVPGFVLVAVLLCGWLAGAAPVHRLAATGKLWAAVKYFHPWLAWRPLDWDAALMRAAPRVTAAASTEAYAAAVQTMLDALGDPATRVVRRGPLPPPPGPLSRSTGDGILILTIHPATLAGHNHDTRALRDAAQRIRTARGVIFDLRGHGGWGDQDPAAIGLAFLAGGVNHQLQAVALKAPGHRSRLHSGLPASAPGGSLFYHSAFYVRDGAVLEARAGLESKPVVFLADETSCLPPIAAALHGAGHAWIVAQGAVADTCLVERHRIEMGEGIEVRLRISELVYQDGTTGLAPDVILPAGDGARALEAALELVRNPRRAAPSRTPLPPLAAAFPEKAYATPGYPPPELRLLAAFRIWAAFRYFFAYRELMAADWDQVLENSIEKLLRAEDAGAYALAVAEMVAHAADSHVAVESRALDQYFGRAAPCIRTRIIAGLPVVTRILDRQVAREAGVALGDVILEVDGEPAEARRRRLGRYLAASTPQSLDHLVMQRWLNGPPGSEALLKLRDAAGRIRTARLPRTCEPWRQPWRDGPVVQVFCGDIGYADLERLVPEQVQEMFETLRRTRAIIFDLRGYPQGTAWRIAPRLTDRKQVAAARFRRPLALFAEGGSGDIRTLGAGWEFLQYLPESAEWKYRGQTVALIDERAMSQAEHAGLFLRAANGTRFIGSRTAGANGDVARFTVPGGITISFSGQEIRHPDGARLQRVGLIPDLEVRPTVEGIRAGRDEVLEAALRYLGAAPMPPPPAELAR